MNKSKEFMDNRAFIVSRIIIDREYDIPVEIYDEVDDSVIYNLINNLNGHELIEKQYKTNKHMQDFFNFVREVRRKTADTIPLFNTLTLENPLFRYLIFNNSDWKHYLSLCYRPEGFSHSIDEDIAIITREPMFYDRFTIVIKLIRDILGHINNKSFLLLMRGFFINHNVRYLVDIAYMLEYNKRYDETMYCLDTNIPVLYKNGSPLSVYMYLQTVIDSEYDGLLDPAIVKQLSDYKEDEDVEFEKMLDMVHTIGVTLNHRNLKYYYIIGKYTATESAIVSDLSKVRMDISCRINDFRDIIQIIGEGNLGISTNLQKLFLESGGDIESMFDDNIRLYPESSIFRLRDQLSVLLSILSIEQIRFLLLNCPEFTKNVMVSTELSLPEYTKIARALLIYPIDTELYDILNPEGLIGTTDYRAYIINMIITGITKNVLFKVVPESMAYIEPSVAYVVENLTYDTVKFVPLHRIVHSIKQIISRGTKYQRFNLYNDGKYVSILVAIDNDIQFMINEISNGGRYGYICDLMINDVSGLIDTFTELKMKKR